MDSAAGATNSVQRQSVVIPVWPQRQVPELGGRSLRISSSTAFLFGNRDRYRGVVLTMEMPQIQLSTARWTLLFGNRDRYRGVVLTMEMPQILSSIVWRTLLSGNRDRSPSGLSSCFPEAHSHIPGANSSPTTLSVASETHLTISNSKYRPTAFQVSRGLHRKSLADSCSDRCPCFFLKVQKTVEVPLVQYVDSIIDVPVVKLRQIQTIPTEQKTVKVSLSQ